MCVCVCHDEQSGLPLAAQYLLHTKKGGQSKTSCGSSSSSLNNNVRKHGRGESCSVSFSFLFREADVCGAFGEARALRALRLPLPPLRLSSPRQPGLRLHQLGERSASCEASANK